MRNIPRRLAGLLQRATIEPHGGVHAAVLGPARRCDTELRSKDERPATRRGLNRVTATMTNTVDGETGSVHELPLTEETARDLADPTATAASAEGIPHNLVCLNTLWTLALIDQPLLEQAKDQLGDRPDFAKDGQQPAIGGPAAALEWMIESNLLTRAQFEALAERYIREGVEREKNQKEDLQRILIVETVDSGFCDGVFRKEMSLKKARIYSPYISGVILFIAFFYLLPMLVRFLRHVFG